MKKYALDMKVVENNCLHKNYCLLKLTCDEALPEMLPGQFVQVLVSRSSTTFLRRPISIHFVNRAANELWLLVRLVGDGTRCLSKYRPGDVVNIILPLGNGFTIPSEGEDRSQKLLLVGGGVGVAPMLYLGATLKEAGFEPVFLLGGRSKEDVLQLDEFTKIGAVHVTTEDGSLGEKGFVTNHPVLKNVCFDRIYTCGPKPMMMAVAGYAASQSITCEVSLENMMACGIGACLCCVENTKSGHVCVCKEGPVFNIDKLTWQS